MWLALLRGSLHLLEIKMDEIRMATAADSQLQCVARLIKTGWPEQCALGCKRVHLGQIRAIHLSRKQNCGAKDIKR